jgi:hypothetical protein
MFLGIITLITALLMASTAAWFAIVGIMAIFAGAPIAALIMGAVIELGKVVGVSWLYRNWKEKTSLKGGVILVGVAMLLTSMGIFGFLSKAHLEQTVPAGANVAQIERIELRVEREKKRIEDAQKVTEQLDGTVQALIDSKRIRGDSGAKAVRESQQVQRDELSRVINDAEDQIANLEDQKMVLTSEKQKLALEIGPVKYIAGFFYDDVESNMDVVVRWVILAFIFVFDPMAIWLLMAANYTFLNRKKKVVDQTPDPAPIGPIANAAVEAPVSKPKKARKTPKKKSVAVVATAAPKKLVPNATATFVPAPVEEKEQVDYVLKRPGRYAKVPHKDKK